MEKISVQQLATLKIRELGLDPGVFELTSDEVLSCALRRMAGLLGPCVAATLISRTVRPLRGVAADEEVVRRKVEETFEALVAYGDLLEQRSVAASLGSGTTNLIYPGPSSFVMRHGGDALVLGVCMTETEAIAHEPLLTLEHSGHVRRVRGSQGIDLAAVLRERGYQEIAASRWMKAPQNTTPQQHVAKLDRLLDEEPPSQVVPGLDILDATKPVQFYRGRWTAPKAQSGRFIARRKQSFGAPLWCYVELLDGKPRRLLNLPLLESGGRGCDDAWYLQLAIDAARGVPQVFTVGPGVGTQSTINVYSPLPMWLQRRWDAVGSRRQDTDGLFAYSFRRCDVDEETRFLSSALWMQQVGGSG